MNPSRSYLLRALYEWLVDNQCTPHIVVDTTIKGVMVPVQFVSDGQIVLNINSTAVQDLLLSEDAVSFNARFGGVPMNVYVPMVAVVAIYAKESGMGMGFGMEPGVEFFDNPEVPPNDPAPSKPSRPKLQVVK
ncbi:MAG: stringent starvation protein B [Osedax symbiont Rs1]|nr:MAG: stringent starvation protein B [Osedax symbiont Rs1]